ncbi:MAG: hydantoinase/oxoprolinase family protein, partial [Chloroflexi bacterium]|nr:hydantoinase/oxoprolinase family protein [Chloroflexota bacterium]
PLAERGMAEVMAEGVARDDIVVEQFLDIRYRGQSYELTVPFGPSVMADFHEAHRFTYGYARPDAPLEVVNVRARALGHVPPPPIPAYPGAGADPSPALIERRDVMLDEKALVPFYRGEDLRPDNVIAGPAIVLRSDTTILIGAGDRARVDAYENLSVNIGGD